MPEMPEGPFALPRCGAFADIDGTTTWRVWAPRASEVELLLVDREGQHETIGMVSETDGCFSHTRQEVAEGQGYFYRLDGGRERPDPASRWQPEGIHRHSAVVYPERFRWNDHGWRGVRREDLVMYEVHVGTFTPEGTLDSAIRRIPDLKELGITAIELMPLAQFPGARGWGYDGVHPFAVQNSYGGPHALLRFVDACHQAQIGVILDVVYNHLGPEGNYLNEFGPYFCDRYQTPWGRAVNYDDGGCDGVREFVLDNVRHWVRDFHIDGLRLDAVHTIYDFSPRHILREIKVAADEAAEHSGRRALVIAESDLNDVRLLDSTDQGGYALDGQWSDDLHHCIHTVLTGEHRGYYLDFGDPAQLVKALNSTFVYDGQFSRFRNRRHGGPAGEHPGDCFVVCIQNHDQVGNRARGDRFGTLLSPAQQRLAAGLLLLSPHVPLLFMGEEYGENQPFPFFCSFLDPFLVEAVRNGRRDEFSSFDWAGPPPDPQSEEVFEMARLSWSWPEGTPAAGLRRLYRDLIALRKTHPALHDFQTRHAELHSTSHGPILGLSRGGSEGTVTIQAWLSLNEAPIPLEEVLATAERVLLWSESTDYGGSRLPTTCDLSLQPFEFVVTEARRSSNPTDLGEA